MRISLTVPIEKIDELLRVTGANSRSQAIEVAIDTFLRRARLKAIKSLKGRLAIDDSWKVSRGRTARRNSPRP